MITDEILNVLFSIFGFAVDFIISAVSPMLNLSSPFLAVISDVAYYAGIINYYVPVDFIAAACLPAIFGAWCIISFVSIILKLL